MNAPVQTPISAGAAADAHPVAPAPLVPSSHDVWGDLAALTLAGDLRAVRLEASCHRDPGQRNFVLRGETRRRDVSVVGPRLGVCAERLCAIAEADAAGGLAFAGDREVGHG